MEEIWIDIFDGYKISNLGNVIGRLGNALKQSDRNKKGYMRVTFWLNHKAVSMSVHRLVADAFIPITYTNETVNHINGIKDDNRVTNLEWNTREENAEHAYHTGLMKCNLCSRINDDDKDMMRMLYPSLNTTELAAIYGIANSHAWKIVK